MEGLQRRYTLNEILAIKAGMRKIEPLNYNGLRMLRDPLYVKFAQTLKDESTDRQASITAHKEFKILLQKLASERGIPLDQLEALLRSLKAPKDEDEGDDDSKKMDTSSDDDYPPKPSGGGPGPSNQQPPDDPTSGGPGPEDEPPPSGGRRIKPFPGKLPSRHWWRWRLEDSTEKNKQRTR